MRLTLKTLLLFSTTLLSPNIYGAALPDNKVTNAGGATFHEQVMRRLHQADQKTDQNVLNVCKDILIRNLGVLPEVITFNEHSTCFDGLKALRNHIRQLMQQFDSLCPTRTEETPAVSSNIPELTAAGETPGGTDSSLSETIMGLFHEKDKGILKCIHSIVTRDLRSEVDFNENTSWIDGMRVLRDKVKQRKGLLDLQNASQENFDSRVGSPRATIDTIKGSLDEYLLAINILTQQKNPPIELIKHIIGNCTRLRNNDFESIRYLANLCVNISDYRLMEGVLASIERNDRNRINRAWFLQDFSTRNNVPENEKKEAAYFSMNECADLISESDDTWIVLEAINLLNIQNPFNLDISATELSEILDKLSYLLDNAEAVFQGFSLEEKADWLSKIDQFAECLGDASNRIKALNVYLSTVVEANHRNPADELKQAISWAINELSKLGYPDKFFTYSDEVDRRMLTLKAIVKLIQGWGQGATTDREILRRAFVLSNYAKDERTTDEGEQAVAEGVAKIACVKLILESQDNTVVLEAITLLNTLNPENLDAGRQQQLRDKITELLDNAEFVFQGTTLDERAIKLSKIDMLAEKLKDNSNRCKALNLYILTLKALIEVEPARAAAADEGIVWAATERSKLNIPQETSVEIVQRTGQR